MNVDALLLAVSSTNNANGSLKIVTISGYIVARSPITVVSTFGPMVTLDTASFIVTYDAREIESLELIENGH